MLAVEVEAECRIVLFFKLPPGLSEVQTNFGIRISSLLFTVVFLISKPL